MKAFSIEYLLACVAGISAWHAKPGPAVVPANLPSVQRACGTPTAGMGEQRRATVISTFTSRTYADYAKAMGAPTDLTAQEVAVETDPGVCTAVTNAIVQRNRGNTADANYLVLRARTRFLAIDPTGRASFIYSISRAYNDICVSL